MERHHRQADSFALRVLATDDVHEVARLHREIRQSLPDIRFLYARDVEFFERLIASEGVIVGAFREGQLVAYGAIILPGAETFRRDYALAHLNVDGSALAFGSGCGVHPEHRRAGLFRRLVGERSRQAALRGCSHVTAVVSPRNEPSLRVLHGLGHAAVGLHHDEDGENFLLVQPTDSVFPVPRACTVQIPLVDCDENLRFLRGQPTIGLPLHADEKPVFAYVDPRVLLSHRLSSE